MIPRSDDDTNLAERTSDNDSETPRAPAAALSDADARIANAAPTKPVADRDRFVPVPAKRPEAETTATVLDPEGAANGDRTTATTGDDGDGKVVAERRIAALEPVVRRRETATAETRSPIGAGGSPSAPAGAAGADDPDWKRLTLRSTGVDRGGAQSPDVGGKARSDVEAPRDLGLATPRRTGPAFTPRSRTAPANGLVVPKTPPSDVTANTEAPADVSPKDRSGAADTPRLAALSPELRETPRTDLMYRALEPDPVAAKPAPGDLRVLSVGESPKLGVSDDGSAAPTAKRATVTVKNEAASSYSFFTPTPRQDARRGDRRTAGTARPAGSVSPELGDRSVLAPGGRASGVDPGSPRILSNPQIGLGAALARLPVSDDAPEAPAGDAGRLAARPNATDACTTPPSAELEIRRAAQSVVRITAPCQADSVAELSYSGLRLAIPLDREGVGSVLALGFEANAAALVRFVDGEVLDFDIPFTEINRIDRVAVIWELPVALELHALEFGARTGEDDHVHPGNRRDFRSVRRKGGGFLNAYRSYAGVGQNAQIYTIWKRGRTRDGVVKLMIDYASRNRDRLEGTCGTGSYAAPGFIVVRSSSGQLERPIIRRLAAISCSSVAQEIGDKRLISSAIDDLVITD